MPSKYKWDNSNKPNVEGKAGTNAGLGDKMEQMFTRFVQRVFLWVIDFLSDRLVDIFDTQMKILRPGMERATAGMFPHLRQIKGMPPFFYQFLDAVEKEQGETSFFTKLFVMYATVRGIVFGGLQPYSDLANQWALNNIRTWLPDANTASFMRYIGLLDEQPYKNILGGLGVPDGLQPKLLELARKIPNIGEIIQGRWRGVISEQEFTSLLKRQGFDDKAISLYKELSINIPPISDLLVMLRREAFQDEVASKYGYDEEYPTAINEYLQKQGYDPKWGKMYYRSAWTVPSPTMAFEMLHRGLIDQSTLDDILKIADYPPFWRKKISDISYHVLTRVDLRRLLQAGMIDREKAYKTYKEMGYRDEDAELLTEFALQGITQDERDLTKTDILNLYEEGLIDRGETASDLIKMGYDSDEAESILRLADVNIAKAARVDLINFTKEKFLAKKVDANGARSELTQLGLKSQSVDRYILNWERSVEIEAALPGLADIKKWYLLGYFGEPKLREYLKQHRHTDDNIALYVRMLNDQKEESEPEPPTPPPPSTGPADRLPSITDIKRWYLTDLITETRLRDYLARHNYSGADIDLYVRLWTIEKQEASNEQAQ